MTAEEMVKGLLEIGWFEQRATTAAAELLKHLKEVQADGYPEELLYREIADVTYLTDDAEDDDAYVELIKEFAAASRGAFQPDGIASDDEEDDEGFQRVTFSVGGREYSIPYDGESKYIGADMVTHINGALAHMHVKERFHHLPAVDEGIGVVFVRPELYKRAVSRGLIPSAAPK